MDVHEDKMRFVAGMRGKRVSTSNMREGENENSKERWSGTIDQHRADVPSNGARTTS